MEEEHGDSCETEDRTRKAFRRSNSGNILEPAGRGAAQAQGEILAESERCEVAPCLGKRRAIINRSKDLAKAPLKALITGALVPAFGDAGNEMCMAAKKHEEYGGACAACVNDESNEALKREMDRLEVEAAQQTDYATCKEFGEKQSE